jgi:hypothetical protein
MPLGAGVKFRSKRINRTHYIRLAYRGNKVVEAVLKKYKRRRK